MNNIQDVLSKRTWQTAPSYSGKRDVQLCAADCPECGGIGWVRYDVMPDDPRFGKLQPCSMANTDSTGQTRRLGLKKQERDLKWSDILAIPGSNAVQAARTVRGVIERGYGWVYLWGEYGNAKSLILQVATAACYRAGIETSYVRMAEILDHLREGYSTGDYSSRMDWWQDVPVLCIDEFEKVNEKHEGKVSWVGEKRFVMMDNRYVNALRGEGVTIMAGNVDPSTFEGYLWDRIRDGRFEVIRITGESVRPGMSWDDSPIPVDRASVFETGEKEQVNRQHMKTVWAER
jgi:DNA replication protein DnaC